MSDLKQAWKKTAKSLVLAADDLGKAVVDSVKVGREKVLEWAQTDDEPIQVDATEIPTEDVEESAEATTDTTVE